MSERDVLRCTGNLEQECEILDLPARSLTDVLDDARAIWQATGRNQDGALAMDALDNRIAKVRDAVEKRSWRDHLSRPAVTLLEWLDPLYCSGHWTPQLIDWAGAVDTIGQVGQPSRVLTWDEFANANPDILLVACCGMDEARTRKGLAEATSNKLPAGDLWQNLHAVRKQHVHTFDGSAFFNRPGPRLVDSLETVAQLVEKWHSAQA